MAATRNGNGSKMLASVFGVGTVVLGLFAGVSRWVDPVARDLTHLRQDVQQMQTRMGDQIDEHIRSRGHAGTLAECASLRASMQRMETLAEKIAAVGDQQTKHQALSGHPGVMIDEAAMHETLRAVGARLEAIEGWMIDHDKRVMGLNAAQWERIKASEKLIDMVWQRVFKESIPAAEPAADPGIGTGTAAGAE